MAGRYNHKYTLTDFFNEDGTFKAYTTGNKLTFESVKEKGTGLKGKDRREYIKKNLNKKNKKDMSVDLNHVIDLLYDFTLPPFNRHYNKGQVLKEGNQIIMSGKLKKQHDLDMAYDDVYETIKTNKGMLEQMLCNYSMLMDAVAFSYSMKTTPHLYLTLTNKRQLKDKMYLGRISSARTMFMQEIMQNIYFNNSFKAIRQAYGIENEKLIGTRNVLKKYQDEKERWEKRVGKRRQ